MVSLSRRRAAGGEVVALDSHFMLCGHTLIISAEKDDHELVPATEIAMSVFEPDLTVVNLRPSPGLVHDVLSHVPQECCIEGYRRRGGDGQKEAHLSVRGLVSDGLQVPNYQLFTMAREEEVALVICYTGKQ